MRAIFAAALVLLVPLVSTAQEATMHAGALAHALNRLGSTGRVLYVAAHPDDENTRLLTWLANKRHVRAAYLSMTRGGGGQNLIGKEQGELLDVIRTEELLAARTLDGAEQRFTTMRDFGFSKSAEETFEIWGKEKALADVVQVIRSFQPDVIVTRFNEERPNHGHHTASAILAREAFAAAADPTRFRELGLKPWQAERLLYNVSHWRPNPPADAMAIDVGGYDPRLGMDYGELAARSRSEHKSQGFGAAGERGSIVERFSHLAGSKPRKDLLEGIELGWKRYGPEGERVQAAIDRAQRSLDRDHPERAIPALLEVRKLLHELPTEPRVLDALRDLDPILAAATGLFARAQAATPTATPGERVEIQMEIRARLPGQAGLLHVVFPDGGRVDFEAPLLPGQKTGFSWQLQIPDEAPISIPYWLEEAPERGSYAVSDRSLVGTPRTPGLEVAVAVSIAGQPLTLYVPVVHSYTDRVHGERIRPFLVVPPATITPVREAVLPTNGSAAPVALRVRAGREGLRGRVELELPTGWSANPAFHEVELAGAGDETTVHFAVQAPAGAAPAEARPSVVAGGRRFAFREDVIDYPHIPMQVVLQPARLRVAPLEIALPEGIVGYFHGSGDSIPEDLAHVGMKVELLSAEDLRSGDLSRYQAIVIGIRAYNMHAALRANHQRLMRWVEQGGTVVVQYNTTSPWEKLETSIGPYPLELTRDNRITDENAPVTPLVADHPILRSPNTIVAADFDGWVQERGLYYAAKWDRRYQPLLRMADRGEAPQDGATLVANHGQGRYVYTGLSFFRQLRAGVPGAYRLFVNLVAGK